MALAEVHARAQVDVLRQRCLVGCQARQAHGGGWHVGQAHTAAHTARQHIGFVPELAQPAGYHRGADVIVVEQHDTRTAHADVQVGALHQLPAGHMLRARQATRCEFFRGAYVAQE